MSFFSDIGETSKRYGSYISEFQHLFDRHEVKFGAQEDFFQLAPKLAYDDKFRVDFSELTKSIGKREEGRLTLTRALTIIAIAMGGTGIEHLGSASAVPISLVVVFLAGVGGWSETEPQIETEASGEASRQAGGVAAPVETPEKREELEGLELEKRLALRKDDLEGLTASLFGGPALLKEALSRLEINTLALKLHLDSIDSRIERIEPHLDDLSSRIGSVAGPGAGGSPIATNVVPMNAVGGSSVASNPVGSKSFAAEDVPVKVKSKPAGDTNGRTKIQLAAQRYSQPAMRSAVAEAMADAVAAAPAPPAAMVAFPAMAKMGAVEVTEVDEAPKRAATKKSKKSLSAPEPAVQRRPATYAEIRRVRVLIAGGFLLFVLAGVVVLLLYTFRGSRLGGEGGGSASGSAVEGVQDRPVSAEVTAAPAGGGLPQVAQSGVTPQSAANIPVKAGRGDLANNRVPVDGSAKDLKAGRLPEREVARSVASAPVSGEAGGVAVGGRARTVENAAVVTPVASGEKENAVGTGLRETGSPNGSATDANGGASNANSAAALTPSGTNGAGTGVTGSGAGASGTATNANRGAKGADAISSGGVAPSGVAAPNGGTPPNSSAALSSPVGLAGEPAAEATVPSVVREPLKPASGEPLFVPAEVLGRNAIAAPKPDYPMMAKLKREEGNVILQALISETGTVRDVRVVSGPTSLRAAAVTALRSWKYKPYLLNGRPVEVRTYLNFRFTMSH